MPLFNQISSANTFSDWLGATQGLIENANYFSNTANLVYTTANNTQTSSNNANTASTRANTASTNANTANTNAWNATSNNLIMISTTPSTNKGQVGDKRGWIYLGNTEFYYCTANHDGSGMNIWSRIVSSNSW